MSYTRSYTNYVVEWQRIDLINDKIEAMIENGEVPNTDEWNKYMADLITVLPEEIARLWEDKSRAVLWMETGDDEDALKAKANEQVQVCHMMFGFYMDRQQNAIGDTGWDWIKGKLGAAMRRRAKGE